MSHHHLSPTERAKRREEVTSRAATVAGARSHSRFTRGVQTFEPATPSTDEAKRLRVERVVVMDGDECIELRIHGVLHHLHRDSAEMLAALLEDELDYA